MTVTSGQRSVNLAVAVAFDDQPQYSTQVSVQKGDPTTNLQPAALEQLRTNLRGPLIAPGDADDENARQGYLSPGKVSQN